MHHLSNPVLDPFGPFWARERLASIFHGGKTVALRAGFTTERKITASSRIWTYFDIN
jgi:hypothetical protein